MDLNDWVKLNIKNYVGIFKGLILIICHAMPYAMSCHMSCHVMLSVKGGWMVLFKMGQIHSIFIHRNHLEEFCLLLVTHTRTHKKDIHRSGLHWSLIH